jgi:hypothetical protein
LKEIFLDFRQARFILILSPQKKLLSAFTQVISHWTPQAKDLSTGKKENLAVDHALRKLFALSPEEEVQIATWYVLT